jgi:glucoamylase
MDTLEAWIERQHARSVQGMLLSVSPLELVKQRPGFGQTVRVRRGAIVASPVLADWNPDPDYFFHWYRDSALVIDALRLLHESGAIGAPALAHLADFIDFSLALQDLDGRTLAAAPEWRGRVAADFARFVRDDADLGGVHGAAVAAESRVNADGTLDISRWSRPQHDGAPLRALAVLRWMPHVDPDADLMAAAARLVRADLDFTLDSWQRPSYDIWEEEPGLHYYTVRVAAAALQEGAGWAQERGDAALAHACRDAAAAAHRRLDGYWSAERGYFLSRRLAGGGRSAKELDIAVVLGAIHAPAIPGQGLDDPRLHATLSQLEAAFDADYAINRARPAGRGPAMGRYRGDVYFSGGAYYFSTLGAAEFCFGVARVAAAASGSAAGSASGPASAAAAASWRARGDAYLATVRAYTPAGGELSEQFDRSTGAQTSARQLAWSHAAFISAVAARRAAGAAH